MDNNAITEVRIRELTDQIELTKIAKSNKDWNLRKVAVETLSNYDILMEIIDDISGVFVITWKEKKSFRFTMYEQWATEKAEQHLGELGYDMEIFVNDSGHIVEINGYRINTVDLREVAWERLAELSPDTAISKARELLKTHIFK